MPQIAGTDDDDEDDNDDNIIIIIIIILWVKIATFYSFISFILHNGVEKPKLQNIHLKTPRYSDRASVVSEWYSVQLVVTSG